MRRVLNCLWNDETGFIISAELVLVGTIVGLGMVVGLSEISCAVNSELKEIAQGFAACNSESGCHNDSDCNSVGHNPSEPQHEQSCSDFQGIK